MCTTKGAIHNMVMWLKEDAVKRAVENEEQSRTGRTAIESSMTRLFHLLRMWRASSATLWITIDVAIETIETSYLVAATNAREMVIAHSSSAASI
jgi:hypothetical protein